MANCEDFCKVVYAFSRYVPTGGEVDTSMTPQEYRKLLELCDAKYKAYQAAGVTVETATSRSLRMAISWRADA